MASVIRIMRSRKQEMELDCSSPKTAVTSLAELFDTTEAELLSLLNSVSPYNGDASPENVIYDQVCERFGPPYSLLKVTWFHSTRVEDHTLFLERGILPKSAAKEIIEPRLKELAKDLVAAGDNPFSLSMMGKQGEHDEGPFAFLIRDVAIHAPGGHHNYLQSPEVVEDISGTLLGRNCDALISRFKDITRPYLITFTAEPQGDEIPLALFYVKLIHDGHPLIEAAHGANTCFCGNGRVIPPDQIRSIEHIPDV